MNKKGFTLVEIMVVVFILATIISFFTIDIVNFWEDSKVSTTKTQLYTIRKLIHTYANEHSGLYPHDFRTLIEEGYIKSVPINPMTNNIDWEARAQGDDPSSAYLWKRVNKDGSIGGPTEWNGKLLFDVRVPDEIDPDCKIDSLWKETPWR